MVEPTLAGANGYYCRVTRDAVVQFQRERGLAPTGFVNFNTWQALGFNTNQTSPAVQQPQNNNRVNPNNQNNIQNNSLCTGNNVCTVVPEM
jgi:peptidoglycan hydrolase-like protein with peptidoglycan-binding domain